MNKMHDNTIPLGMNANQIIYEKINLKQSKGGDLSLRTVVKLPNGSGKKNKVAVLCEADKIDEAKKAGADVVGSDDLIESISAGKFNFTKLILN